MTNLLHELRSYLGGELGNRAADEIERQAKEVARYKADAFAFEQRYRSAVAYGTLGFTIETVKEWLDLKGLTAVSKADAEKVERCKTDCTIGETARRPAPKMVSRICANAKCASRFMAREADVKRGWAKFCCKSCKAIKQEQRTGQFAAYKQSQRDDVPHESTFEGAHLFSNEEHDCNKD